MPNLINDIKTKVCNKCRVYITLNDSYISIIKEKYFDENHYGHPREMHLLSDIKKNLNFVSEDEKYENNASDWV